MGWGPAKEPASQCASVCRNYPLANNPLVSPLTFTPTRKDQGKTKGQQLKGKIVSEFFHTFWHWSRRYAERIWGEFFILVRRILGKLPANFSANFDGEF